MKDKTIYIGVEISLMLACIVIGIAAWGGLINAFSVWVNLGNPHLWAAGLMFIINVIQMWQAFFRNFRTFRWLWFWLAESVDG